MEFRRSSADVFAKLPPLQGASASLELTANLGFELQDSLSRLCMNRLHDIICLRLRLIQRLISMRSGETGQPRLSWGPMRRSISLGGSTNSPTPTLIKD